MFLVILKKRKIAFLLETLFKLFLIAMEDHFHRFYLYGWNKNYEFFELSFLDIPAQNEISEMLEMAHIQRKYAYSCVIW